MQIVLVVQGLFNEYAEGPNEKAKAFFNKVNVTQFLLQYLKDMRNDFLQVCVPHEVVAILGELQANLS